MHKLIIYFYDVFLKPKKNNYSTIDKHNVRSLLIVYFILMLTFAAGSFYAPIQVQTPLRIGFPVLIAGYLVTRYFNYRIGGFTIIGVLYLVALLIIFIFDTDNNFNYLSFSWIMITVFIGTLFLNTKYLIVLTFLENISIAGITILRTDIDVDVYISWFFFNIFFCLINIAVRIIIDQQREELKLQNINLETKVKMRTTQLNRNIEEKDVLIRELYHRSNNNMQIINALMHLQFDSISNQETKAALRKTRSRLDAMALVHNKLYSSKDLRFISLKDYLADILEQIMHSLKVDRSSFKIMTVIEDHRIPLELSIPLGLIINELLTNVFIHTDRTIGSAELQLQVKIQKGFILYIRLYNTCSRVAPDADLNTLQNTGLKLVKLLVVDQLKGGITYNTDRNCFLIEAELPLTDFEFDDRQHTHSEF